ncbi:UNVERIFIED_CONTAM: hypothetical protein K2H54_018840 [Gekko kuhli]
MKNRRELIWKCFNFTLQNFTKSSLKLKTKTSHPAACPQRTAQPTSSQQVWNPFAASIAQYWQHYPVGKLDLKAFWGGTTAPILDTGCSVCFLCIIGAARMP